MKRVSADILVVINLRARQKSPQGISLLHHLLRLQLVVQQASHQIQKVRKARIYRMLIPSYPEVFLENLRP